MISLITVLVDCLNPFFEIFVESLTSKLKYVSEVIAIRADKESSHNENFTFKNINFKIYGSPLLKAYTQNQGHSHTLALHEAIEKATQEYIYFSDPDVFFYNAADEIYLELMDKHGLSIIGCSHHNAVALSQFYFPYLVSCLVKKSDLPDENFLKGKLKLRPHQTIAAMKKECPDDPGIIMDGKYLLPGAIPEHYNSFLNPDKENCVFDSGCNLCLWALQKNWKWLAFQTLDCHTYTTRHNRGSIRLNLPKTKLIYHAVGGTRPYYELNNVKRTALMDLLENYEEAKND